MAPPPLHPVIRKDVFYAWHRTTDPGGYTTETLMEDFGDQEYSQRTQPMYYRMELSRNAPDLIVLPRRGEQLYEPMQWRVLKRYLYNNADDFEFLSSGYLYPVAVRRTTR